MTRIEQIEELLRQWEARSRRSIDNNMLKTAHMAANVAFGLTLAIGVLNDPSNKVNATDKKPCCIFCASQHELKPYDKYCGKCGRAFDR